MLRLISGKPIETCRELSCGPALVRLACDVNELLFRNGELVMAMKNWLKHFLYVHYVLLNISVNPILLWPQRTVILVRIGPDHYIYKNPCWFSNSTEPQRIWIPRVNEGIAIVELPSSLTSSSSLLDFLPKFPMPLVAILLRYVLAYCMQSRVLLCEVAESSSILVARRSA